MALHALVKCWSAYRLPRLAQSVCPRSGIKLDRGIFSKKEPYKVALVKCWHAFQLRRLAQTVVLGSGVWHFSCTFPYKVALVKCWHAFGLRRLAQSVVLGSGARHLSCKFPYKVALVTCWSAFRLRRLAQSACPRSDSSLLKKNAWKNFWFPSDRGLWRSVLLRSRKAATAQQKVLQKV